jgi:hypothetical protein
MAESQRRVRVHPSTLHRELEGEGVLLQLDTGQYYGLDDVAQRMWALIALHGDLAEVQARLLEEFEVEPEVLSRDLNRLVDELAERQLVTIDGGPEGSSDG